MGLSAVKSRDGLRGFDNHASWMIRYQNNCEGMEEIIGPVLTIVDIGDHRRQLTITNDVEYVVHMLWLSCALADQARLCYIDSENIRCEIRHDQGKFLGFGPWGREGEVE